MLLRQLAFCLSVLGAITLGAVLPVYESSVTRLGARQAPPNTTVAVQGFENSYFFVNITLGGTEYTVVIDSGSLALWVYANVTNATDTGWHANVTYDAGSIQGNVQTASLSFAGFDVASQAFIDVQDASALGFDPRDSGFTGLMGLSPPIFSAALGNETNPALSVPNSIFMLNRTSGNYITVLLPRNEDPGSTTVGAMTISELLPGNYTRIAQMTKLPVSQIPADLIARGLPQFWLTLTDVDGIIGPNGQPIVYQSQARALGPPVGPVAVVLDTGFSLSQVPESVSDAIYQSVPGALYNPWLFGGTWEVPCNQSINLAFSFGGQRIPIHPLDVVQSAEGSLPDGICIGSFQPIGDGAASPAYDMILGTNFLRNVYMLLDYGTFVNSTNDRNEPYIQLLSTTDPVQAAQDFNNVRLGN